MQVSLKKASARSRQFRIMIDENYFTSRGFNEGDVLDVDIIIKSIVTDNPIHNNDDTAAAATAAIPFGITLTDSNILCLNGKLWYAKDGNIVVLNGVRFEIDPKTLKIISDDRTDTKQHDNTQNHAKIIQ